MYGGIPSVDIFAKPEKIRVNTPEFKIGCIIYQNGPKIVCL